MFKNPEDYPFVKEIEEAYPIIRQEFDDVAAKADLFIDWEGRDYEAENGVRKAFGSSNNAGLNIIGLMFFKQESEQLQIAYPKTTEIFKRCIPGLSFLVFSRVKPHKSVDPHVGYNNGILRGHLGIVVPENCHFGVSSDVRPIVEGKCMVFDDNTIHYAWNDSDQDRIVLIFDFDMNGTYKQTPSDRELDIVCRRHEMKWKRRLEGLHG